MHKRSDLWSLQLEIYDQHNTILCCFNGLRRYLWSREKFCKWQERFFKLRDILMNLPIKQALRTINLQPLVIYLNMATVTSRTNQASTNEKMLKITEHSDGKLEKIISGGGCLLVSLAVSQRLIFINYSEIISRSLRRPPFPLPRHFSPFLGVSSSLFLSFLWQCQTHHRLINAGAKRAKQANMPQAAKGATFGLV